jgi:hypothetical protein
MKVYADGLTIAKHGVGSVPGSDPDIQSKTITFGRH